MTAGTPRLDDAREYYNDLPGKMPPEMGDKPKPALRKPKMEMNLIDLTEDNASGSLPVPSARDPQYVNCGSPPEEEKKPLSSVPKEEMKPLPATPKEEKKSLPAAPKDPFDMRKYSFQAQFYAHTNLDSFSFTGKQNLSPML